MSANYEGILARAFRHRFDYLDNHSLGNLILTAIADETNSFPDAIRVCEGAHRRARPCLSLHAS